MTESASRAERNRNTTKQKPGFAVTVRPCREGQFLLKIVQILASDPHCLNPPIRVNWLGVDCLTVEG